MFHQMATDLILDPNATSPVSSDNPEHSQAVSLDGDNVVELEAKLIDTSLTLGATDGFTITLQSSNDMQNWNDTSVTVSWLSTSTVPSVLFASSFSSTTTVGAQYVRLKYELGTDSTTASVICSATINTSRN